VRDQIDRELQARFVEHDSGTDAIEEIRALLGRRRYMERLLGAAEER